VRPDQGEPLDNSDLMAQLRVVLPTFNEVENVEEIVRAIRAEGAAVLVVDDASPDGTGDRADLLAAEDPAVGVLHRARKDGLGAAYGAGFSRALEDGSPIVGQMDADFSHDPGMLPRLVAAVRHGADVAIGSRYVAGGSTAGWSWLRRMISGSANRYVRMVLGVRTRDATAGFRVYRAEALRRLDPASCRSAGYAFQVEMIYRAERLGLRIEELPIRFVERHSGDSKMTAAIAFEAMWLITGWGLRRLWRRLRSAA
jgi:dolichol-phosphate mannosyltransferase